MSDYEHLPANEFEREEIAADLEFVSVALETFQAEVSFAAETFAAAVRARRPDWICRFSIASRREDQALEEVVAGMIANIAACARDIGSDFLDHSALERAEKQVDTGFDE